MSSSNRSSAATPLHPAIRRALANFRARALVLRGLTTTGTIAAAAGGIFSLALLVDRVFLLSDPMRLFITTLALGPLGGAR